MHALDDYYRQPLRLVAGMNGTYHFFNDFGRVDLLLREEMDLRQPCLIGSESLNDIKRLAWEQLGVSQKVISNYVNHIAKTPVDKLFQKFSWDKKV